MVEERLDCCFDPKTFRSEEASGWIESSFLKFEDFWGRRNSRRPSFLARPSKPYRASSRGGEECPPILSGSSCLFSGEFTPLREGEGRNVGRRRTAPMRTRRTARHGNSNWVICAGSSTGLCVAAKSRKAGKKRWKRAGNVMFLSRPCLPPSPISHARLSHKRLLLPVAPRKSLIGADIVKKCLHGESTPRKGWRPFLRSEAARGGQASRAGLFSNFTAGESSPLPLFSSHSLGARGFPR
jgi:hypothetical protein